MPIIRSAKKRLKQDVVKRSSNDKRRRALKESIKTFESAIKVKDAKAAEAALPKLHKSVDKALKAGVIKKNTTARRKAKAARQLASLSPKKK